jgi:hypothetical protein
MENKSNNSKEKATPEVETVKVFSFSQEALIEELSKQGKLTDEIEESLDGKCGGCNWLNDTLYVAAATEEEAKELLLNRATGEGGGMCGDCFCTMLVESSYKIVAVNDKGGHI